MNVFQFNGIENKWARILEFYALKEQYTSDTVKVAVDEYNKSVIYDIPRTTFISPLFIEDGLKMLFDGEELIGRKVTLAQLKAISHGVYVVVDINGGDEYTIVGFCDYDEAYRVTYRNDYYGSCMPRVVAGGGSILTGVISLGSAGGDCLCSGEPVCHPLSEVCRSLTRAVNAYVDGDKNSVLRHCGELAAEVLEVIGHYRPHDVLNFVPEYPNELKWVADLYQRARSHVNKMFNEGYDHIKIEPLSVTEVFDALSRFCAMLKELLSGEQPIERPSFFTEAPGISPQQDICDSLDETHEASSFSSGTSDILTPQDISALLGETFGSAVHSTRPLPLDFTPKQGQEDLDFGWAAVRLCPIISWR